MLYSVNKLLLLINRFIKDLIFIQNILNMNAIIILYKESISNFSKENISLKNKFDCNIICTLNNHDVDNKLSEIYNSKKLQAEQKETYMNRSESDILGKDIGIKSVSSKDNTLKKRSKVNKRGSSNSVNEYSIQNIPNKTSCNDIIEDFIINLKNNYPFKTFNKALSVMHNNYTQLIKDVRRFTNSFVTFDSRNKQFNKNEYTLADELTKEHAKYLEKNNICNIRSERKNREINYDKTLKNRFTKANKDMQNKFKNNSFYKIKDIKNSNITDIWKLDTIKAIKSIDNKSLNYSYNYNNFSKTLSNKKIVSNKSLNNICNNINNTLNSKNEYSGTQNININKNVNKYKKLNNINYNSNNKSEYESKVEKHLVKFSTKNLNKNIYSNKKIIKGYITNKLINNDSYEQCNNENTKTTDKVCNSNNIFKKISNKTIAYNNEKSNNLVKNNSNLNFYKRSSILSNLEREYKSLISQRELFDVNSIQMKIIQFKRNLK